MLQNRDDVVISYFGFSGTLPLGVALLIAAVAGGAVVLIVGIVRLAQLRLNARRVRKFEKTQAKARAQQQEPPKP